MIRGNLILFQESLEHFIFTRFFELFDEAILTFLGLRRFDLFKESKYVLVERLISVSKHQFSGMNET